MLDVSGGVLPGELDDVTQEALEDANRLLPQLSKGKQTTFEKLSRTVHDAKAEGGFVRIARAAEGKFEGRIVASVTLRIHHRMSESVGLIEQVVVQEEYRGQGIATRLIEDCQERIRATCTDYVDLWSDWRNRGLDIETVRGLYVKRLHFIELVPGIYRWFP